MATLKSRAAVQPAVRDLVLSAQADVPTGASATAGDNAAAINALFAELRSVGLMEE